MSVRAKIILKIFVRVLILIAIAAVLVGIFLYYQAFLGKAENGIWAVPVFAIIFAFVIYKTKIINLVFDRDWEGEVKRVDTVINSEPITFSVAVGRRPPKKIPYTVVIVLKDNGKTVKLKIQSRKMAPLLFKIGDRIKHHKGAKYPIVLTSQKHVYICPICGGWFKESKCPDCRVNF